MSTDRIYVTNLTIMGEKVRVDFSDGDHTFVTYNDYNRALMAIANASKEEIIRDFAIKSWLSYKK